MAYRKEKRMKARTAWECHGCAVSCRGCGWHKYGITGKKSWLAHTDMRRTAQNYLICQEYIG